MKSTFRMALVFAALSAFSFAANAKNIFTHRAIMIFSNANKGAGHFIEIANEAHKHGYNMIFHDDVHFVTIQKKSQKIIDVWKKRHAEAERLNMPIVPMTMGQADPTAYGGDGLNNAEAFRTVTEFAVSGNVAKPVGDPAILFENPGFESGLEGWSGSAIKNKMAAVDNSVKRTGNASVRITNPNRNYVHLAQRVSVKPHRAYELTAWIKTKDVAVSRNVGFWVYAGGRYILCPRSASGVQPTQDWRLYKIAFNSLELKSVDIWLNVTHKPTTGTIWFDDVTIREVGLANTVRRSTCPVTVVSKKDAATYTEGKDFAVAKGSLSIPAGSRIQSGDRLNVTWHMSCVRLITANPVGSFCHDEAWEVLRKNTQCLFENVMESKTRGWLIKYGEWRIGYWDTQCKKEYKTAGAYMGGVAAKSSDLLKCFNPNMEVYIWNDMYDPYHNALRSPYYMMNGSMANNWLDLPKDMVILNWSAPQFCSGTGGKSSYFFAGMDAKHPNVKHRQIVNCNGGVASSWIDRLDEMEKDGLPDGMVIGANYCTWKGDYSKIGYMASQWKTTGRWGSGLAPLKAAAPRACNSAARPATKARMLARASLVPTGKSLRFELPAQARVKVSLNNVQGQHVATLLHESRTAGKHVVKLPSNLAAGVYIADLSTEASSGTARNTRCKAIIF